MRVIVLASVLVLCDALRDEARNLPDEAVTILKVIATIGAIMDIGEWLKYVLG